MTTLRGKRVLLTGASGMLGSDLVPKLLEQKVELLLCALEPAEVAGHSVINLDIQDIAAVRTTVKSFHPQWIINCAAYTDVDGAEKNYAAALQVNALGVANLSRALAEHGGCLLQVSSDYVLGAAAVAAHDQESGEKLVRARQTKSREQRAWTEDDQPHPCGVYGHSKFLGEQFAQGILPQSHLVVRTSWLHGIHGSNFVDNMLKLSRERSELKVVDDQIGSPTWTGWLADVLLQLMHRDARGIFHASSRGNISWYDFAREIFRVNGAVIKLSPQTTTELGRPAPRPPFSTLDVAKLERFIGSAAISWQEGLRQHLHARGIEVRHHA